MPLGGFAPCPLPLGGTALDGVTAEQHARIAADLKAVVSAAPFAVLRLITDSTTPLAYTGQHGVGIGAAPTITLIGIGDVRITWAPSYLDEYDNAQATYIKHAQATLHDNGGPPGVARVEVENARQIRVRSVSIFGPTTYAVSLVVW